MAHHRGHGHLAIWLIVLGLIALGVAYVVKRANAAQVGNNSNDNGTGAGDSGEPKP